MLIFSGLQVPMSIPKTIQPVTVVGGITVSASDLVNSSSEGEEDVCDN
jgi:hypothetical protein